EVKLNMDSQVNQAHDLNYGVSGKLYQVNPGQIDPLGQESIIQAFELLREQGLEAGIYIADNFEISEKLLLNAGVRYSFYAALGEGTQNIYEEGQPKNETSLLETEEYGKNEFMETYGGPEIRFSARYLLMPDLSAKISYNNTFQYIHTLTSNTTMSPTDTYKLSDKNIKPQKASQYSLGLFKNFHDNMYEMSLEGYYKKSENLLDFKVGAQLFLNENIETEVLQGEGRSYGAEFMLKKTSGRLNGWLAYSYSRSFIKLDSEFNEERVNSGEYFPSNFDKPHDFSAVANYKITKRYSFSANLVYQTGRPVTYPTGRYQYNNAEYVVFSDRNKFRIPDYYRLDISFNVEGNHKIKKFAHSFWSISIYNVLGRNNPYSVFFVTDKGEIKAYKTSIFSIPVPTITYNFKF
ncbi:MAG TPA: TonB-dependent receptor, partial [Salinimicrobium sp.]|nr:TonB-dependent receptor [Salinimicrobium sp.]